MPSIPLPRRLVAPLRVLALCAVALLLLGLTALGGTLILAMLRGSPVLEPVNYSGGIICSLITWLFVLSFHIRRESLSVPIADRDAFMGKVLEALVELGYEVSQPSTDRLVGKPSFASLLLGGAVQVQLQGNAATLSGPRISVEGLRNRLRMRSHLESNRRSLEDSGWKLKLGRLRSVQIQFRTPEDQGRTATEELIQALKQLGATLHCDIAIWAQNDAGMEEVVIEKLVRDKLKRQGISVSLHKKPLAQISVEARAVAG